MALDSIEGIREYRNRLNDLDTGIIVGVKAETLALALDTLLGVIEEQDRLLAGGKKNRLESAEIVPLHQRRKVKGSHEGADLL